MKSITLLLLSLLQFSAYSVFADNVETSSNCCPASASVNAAVQQYQLLDQLQLESENLTVHESGVLHEQVSKKVVVKQEEHAMMSSIQSETDSIQVGSLQGIADQLKSRIDTALATVLQ